MNLFIWLVATYTTVRAVAMPLVNDWRVGLAVIVICAGVILVAERGKRDG